MAGAGMWKTKWGEPVIFSVSARDDDSARGRYLDMPLIRISCNKSRTRLSTSISIKFNY